MVFIVAQPEQSGYSDWHRVLQSFPNAEIAEAVQQGGPAQVDSQAARQSAKFSYYQAEDLALRALQAEYATPIQRSVFLAPNLEVDGVFVKDRKVYVVEVKLNFGSVNEERLRMALRRALDAAFHLAGPSAAVALVVVFSREEDVAANQDRLRKLVEDHKTRVDLWLYSLPELRKKFGASGSDA